MALSDSYAHPIPYDPPLASSITIGQVDDLGEATISGAAGAALPLANVFLFEFVDGQVAHLARVAAEALKGCIMDQNRTAVF